MGLQGQLNDVGSDSVALYLIAVIATTISHLRSILHSLLRPIHLHPSPPSDDHHHTAPASSAGSGLADLILLSEHLSLNRHLSYTYHTPPHSPPASSPASAHSCVVCLSRLRNGDTVRSLPCRHVFHKDCFEGWIHHCPTVNFTCPLCRSPLLLEDDGGERRRRCVGVGNDVVEWFDGCSMNY